MQGPYLRKYAVETKINFVLYEVDGVDLRVDAVDAGSDCSIMKNEGDEATCTNDFVDEGKGYSLTLTAAEMTAARIVVYVVDSATKVWLDDSIVIETYGHASAQHALDLDTAIDAAGTAATPAEVATALNTYDAPTKAEMDTAHALLATVAKQDIIDGIVDAILTDTSAQDTATKLRTLLTGVDTPVCKDSTPATTAEIKTAVEADGSKLDHLWEMTEDDAGTRRLTTNALEQAPSGGLNAQQTRDAMKLAPSGNSPAAGSIDKHLDDIVEDTNELQTDDYPTSIAAIKSETALIVADTNELQTDDIPGKIAALNNISTAQVNTEVVDALNVDTYAEPGQEAPPATTTLAKKISYLYKFLRNKITNNGTDIKVYDDAGTTVDQKSSVTKSGGTVTRGKFGKGA